MSMKEKFEAFTRALKEMWVYVVVYLHVQKEKLRLAFAIHMAKQLQKAKNKRFYVVPNAQDKLIWLCNDDIKEMRKPRRVRKLIHGRLVTFKVRLLPKNTTHLDVMRDCVYYTPESWNNSNGITVEERNKRSAKWIEYLERKRFDRMFGKLKMK